MANPNKVAALILAATAACFPIVKYSEGEYRDAYLDPIGIPTICYGHTGPAVKVGMRATKAQCDAYLAADLAVAAQTVARCFPDADKLNPNQFGAFQSFTFNVGPGQKGKKDGFCTLKSGAEPSHLRALKAGDYPRACSYLSQWAKANGVPLRGLVIRRQAEINLCGTPYVK